MTDTSKLVYLFLSFFIALLTIVVIGTTVNPVSPRVIGGINALKGKYPYIASLRSRDRHFCAGSILSKRWILTAAHCITDPRIESWTIEVIVGTNRLDEGGQRYSVEDVVSHKQWGERKFTNDIGLIRVSIDIEFNHRVSTIKLPKEDFNTAGCYPATLIGWGRWDRGTLDSPNDLQVITLRVIRHYTCQRKYAWVLNINEAHICTYNKFGEGSCGGDSGGPLIVDGVQIGIVSFGAFPCAFGQPDVYARVYTYLDWIKNNTGLTVF